MKTSPLVYIVVPNKDGRRHLENCLPSIGRLTYDNLKVAVVDNRSSDDSAEFVLRNCPAVELIRRTSDGGFPASVNTGIVHALNKGADYVVVFSNDVVVARDWLTLSVQTASALGRPSILAYREETGPRREPPMPVLVECNEAASPHCAAIYMLSAAVIKDVGLYDQVYYMYGEDNDFFRRCERRGHRVTQSNIPVWHQGEGYSDDVSKQRFVTKIVYRNWLRMALKNDGWWNAGIVLLKMALYAFAAFLFKRKAATHKEVGRLVRFGFFFRIYCLFYSVTWNLLHVKSVFLMKHKEDQWIAQRGQAPFANYNEVEVA